MRILVTFWLGLLAAPAWAWHAEGHILATHVALDTVGNQLPPFFSAGRDTIAHCSVDPDIFKIKTKTGILKDDEYPDHFFDLELFTDDSLPDNRLDFFFWCLRNQVYIQKIGTLPYALGEAADRLTVALAEYRRWPKDPMIQTKCLVYAGHLAHYTQDLGQPLHTTIDYDGRANSKGTSPRTGIHDKVDALLGKLDPNHPISLAADSTKAYRDLLSAILNEIILSHAEVDTVYNLESQLPNENDNSFLDPNSAVGRFAVERCRESARLFSNFLLTAWIHSAELKIPDWHQR